MSNTITPTVFYRTLDVEGLEIFYREAGPRDAPTMLRRRRRGREVRRVDGNPHYRPFCEAALHVKPHLIPSSNWTPYRDSPRGRSPFCPRSRWRGSLAGAWWGSMGGGALFGAVLDGGQGL